MPWLNPTWYPWNHVTILTQAPTASGVYAISTTREWIYIGEAADIRRRLLQHFNGDNLCITASSPTQFSFELVPFEQPRLDRQNQLILEMQPRCNQTLG